MKSSTAKEADTALEELRAATRELTADYEGLTATIERAKARAGEFEAQAMEAIRRGEDAAAREALLRQQKQMESVESLLADADVVRAMIGECERILDGRGRWS